MWIVAVGWAYVVILMAATETSVIAGIMTFFGYCVLPLSILFYITGAGKRRARRAGASVSSSASRHHGDARMPLAGSNMLMPFGDAGVGHGASDCADSGSGSGFSDCGGGGGDGGGGCGGD